MKRMRLVSILEEFSLKSHRLSKFLSNHRVLSLTLNESELGNVTFLTCNSNKHDFITWDKYELFLKNKTDPFGNYLVLSYILW